MFSIRKVLPTEKCCSIQSKKIKAKNSKLQPASYKLPYNINFNPFITKLLRKFKEMNIKN